MSDNKASQRIELAERAETRAVAQTKYALTDGVSFYEADAYAGAAVKLFTIAASLRALAAQENHNG